MSLWSQNQFRIVRLLFLACALILGSSPALVSAASLDSGSYLIEVKRPYSAGQVAAHYGLQPDFVFEESSNSFASYIISNVLTRLSRDPRIARIIPDREVTIANGGNWNSTDPTGGTVDTPESDHHDDGVLPGFYLVHVAAEQQPIHVAATHRLRPEFVFEAAAHGFSAEISERQLHRLESDPRVLTVIPDRAMTLSEQVRCNSTFPEKLWNMDREVIPAGVLATAPPGSLSADGHGVGVAVVDTGLDWNHADLTPLGSTQFSAFDDDGYDRNGHGTHIGGTIAARANSMGVVGVAAGATLYSVKVLDDHGAGSDATLLAGLDWIADHARRIDPPIRVVNISFSRPGNAEDNPMLRQAIETLSAMGIAVVGSHNTSLPAEQVPAAYDQVLSVAAAAADTGLCADPNRAGSSADILYAPGEKRPGMSETDTGFLGTALGGGIGMMGGPGVATAHVSGIAALLHQRTMGMIAPWEIRELIFELAHPMQDLAAEHDAHTHTEPKERIEPQMQSYESPVMFEPISNHYPMSR